LLQALDQAAPDQTVRLATPTTALRVMQRRLKDATVITLFNESASDLRNSLTLRLRGKVERWDPETGAVSAVAASGSDGALQVPLPLAPYALTVLVVRE
jgi:hypothetical protein